MRHPLHVCFISLLLLLNRLWGVVALHCILSSVDQGRAKDYAVMKSWCLTHCSRALSLYVYAQPQG